MERGLDWYKREPAAVLDAIRAAKMTAVQVAVYNIVLDLIYSTGGETPNDPRYIAAHLSDVGPAKVRRTLDELVAMGKLTVVGPMLHQKRAENEAQTRKNLAAIRANAGRLGGIQSGISRQKSNENSETPKQELQAEPNQIREEEKVERADALSMARASRAASTQGRSRLPPDWQLCQEWGDWAVQKTGMPREAIRLQGQLFGEYWKARAGPKGFKADWFATWKQWISKAAIEWLQRGGSKRVERPSTDDDIQGALQLIAARRRA